MKKVYSFSLAACFSIGLFAFSPPPKVVDFQDITNSGSAFTESEISSFQEAEESETTADKGTWVKRYRVWTDLTSAYSLNTLENFINKN